jgi:hypothetical protein
MLPSRRTYADMTRDDDNHTFTPYIDLSSDDENIHTTHVPNNTRTNVRHINLTEPVEETKDDEYNNGIPIINEHYSTIDNVYDSDRVYLAPFKLGPNAGLGLFAKIDFEFDDYICAYVGNIVPTEPDKEFDSDYRFQYNKKYTIDSTDSQSCYGRYANDPIKIASINATLGPRRDVVEACVRATKSIKKDLDIFISYGDDYWKSKQFFKLPINLQKTLLRRNGSEYKEYINTLKSKMWAKLR